MKEQGGGFLTALKLLRRVIPGNYLRTLVYRALLAKPRKFLRKTIDGFYRMDHIYEVLEEFGASYGGKFSILEFGVADGYSFVKKLYATRYLKMTERVMVHGFDTFEGLPEDSGSSEKALVEGDAWVPGHFHGDYEKLIEHCRPRYPNFELHRGLFKDTIDEKFLESMANYRPILIWIDCDYYSSTMDVFERLAPHIPTGCVIYFDDIYFNFSSRFTGEMKAVWEINHGKLGDGFELVPDTALSCDSNRVYRFVNMNCEAPLEIVQQPTADPRRTRGNDSPLP